jgi:hypothetical protein
MSDKPYTHDQLVAAVEVMSDVLRVPFSHADVAQILDAIAPAIAARALRDAADAEDCDHFDCPMGDDCHYRGFAERLRARAEETER